MYVLPMIILVTVCVCLPFKVCYARMLDYKRKFIEAAQRYNELSYRTIIADGERMESLRHALHCTILASAGEAKKHNDMCAKLPSTVQLKIFFPNGNIQLYILGKEYFGIFLHIPDMLYTVPFFVSAGDAKK